MNKNSKLVISRVLGELIEEYFRSVTRADRDCRLLVPGLTSTIASEVHDYLREKSICSYLVIGSGQEPSKERNHIEAIGLTSVRIGSFVAITSPGQLAQIQDSIRGSGGTIRSQAFSDEWPWIDDGNEYFCLDGPVIKALVEEWSHDEEEQEWMRQLVVNVLREDTRLYRERANILLENILGEYRAVLYDQVDDTRKKLLCHAGIPCPSGELPGIEKLSRDISSLCKKIVERCQGEEGVREQVQGMVNDVVEVESERKDVSDALNCLLDGIGRSRTLSLGVLAFHGCWGESNEERVKNWSVLYAERLAKLFDIKSDKGEAAWITAKFSDHDRSIISEDKMNLATFIDERIGINIEYEIPSDEFITGEWLIQFKRLKKIIGEHKPSEPGGKVPYECDAADLGKHKQPVPLRVVLLNKNNIVSSARLILHVCGQDRPALAIVHPIFEVVDAIPVTEEQVEEDKEEAEQKIGVGTPVQVFLFSHIDESVEVHDENNHPVKLVKKQSRLWSLEHSVDIGAEPSGMAIMTCKFAGKLEAVICLEAENIERGEFTMEDELRVAISKGKKYLEGRGNLFQLFEGESHDLYPMLGKIDIPSRLRISFAEKMTEHGGWKPIFYDFKEKHLHDKPPINYPAMPGEIENMLRKYEDARHELIKWMRDMLRTGLANKHPMYASHPIFVKKHASTTESHLRNYLHAYHEILNYIKTSRENLEWGQLFELVHMDCVVNWDDERYLKHAFFLLGPWHPLVLAKRFMVQEAIFSRAHRLLKEEDGMSFRHLSCLLSNVQGFRWVPGISAGDNSIEHAHVIATSDPGWHLALKIDTPSTAAMEKLEGRLGISQMLRQDLGLVLASETGSYNTLANTCLSDYLRAFPSRRSIGIRIHTGYESDDIVKKVDRYIHDDEGPTLRGQQLPGGVRLYFEKSPGNILDANRWTDPPLHVYRFGGNGKFPSEIHPDIHMLAPVNDLNFKPSRNGKHHLPRGDGLKSVFSKPLNWITEGNNQIPVSRTYEYDYSPGNTSSTSTPGNTANTIGEDFTSVVQFMCNMLVDPHEATSEVALPQELGAPWVVVPGRSVDPAILVKYVQDGIERNIQERALWDYKVDMTDQNNSYYVLSIIPKSFQVAVNASFDRDDISNISETFITELGKIGIAIGSEALRSGRHALGIIGLVGAARLLTNLTKETDDNMGFLVPVDSFASFFGNGKRGDLLAVRLSPPSSEKGILRISACGVEAKFVSGTFQNEQSALEQAKATTDEFKKLVIASCQPGGMPERLALMDILSFGLRISSPYEPSKAKDWLKREREVYNAILKGNYEYSDTTYRGLLFSSEWKLRGDCEYNEPDGCLWVRLTKDCWPGITEPEPTAMKEVREKIGNLFNYQPVDVAPIIPGSKANPSDTLPGKVMPEVMPIEKIFMGVNKDRQKLYFDPGQVDNLNIMITGSSGTGKTQFLKYLACQLREQGKNMLILDMKNDFANDDTFCKKAGLASIHVTFEGMPFNPLIPYPVKNPSTKELVMQCSNHIMGVASVLKRTYNLGPQQQVAVKNAITAAFTKAGIPTDSFIPYDKNRRFPSFADIGKVLRQDNLLAYNRLDPLFTLNLFREEHREQSFSGLVNRASILDLSHISSDEVKNTLAQLVVMSSHAYYNAQPHSGSIRQFLVFDEAHRVLTSDYMLKLVRECRAYGVGTILSSQYPSDFPADISASMATKVIHGNGRDTSRIKEIVQMLGCPGKEEEIAGLEKFHALVNSRQPPCTILRTMHYPLYLAWAKLQEIGSASQDELARASGIDMSRLSIDYIVQQLKRMGLAEERDGRVFPRSEN